MREILAEYVRGKGFELLEADRREKALEQVRGTTPDIVLLDISMPGLGGLETLRRIRATSSATRAGMVMANSDAKMAQNTLDLGAIDHVAKPVDFPYLDDILATHAPTLGERPSGGLFAGLRQHGELSWRRIFSRQERG